MIQRSQYNSKPKNKTPVELSNNSTEGQPFFYREGGWEEKGVELHDSRQAVDQYGQRLSLP